MPVCAAYGLVKGAFLATEAASSLVLYLSKVFGLSGFGALPWPVLAQGLIVGALLLGSGAALLCAAAQHH